MKKDKMVTLRMTEADVAEVEEYQRLVHSWVGERISFSQALRGLAKTGYDKIVREE